MAGSTIAPTPARRRAAHWIHGLPRIALSCPHFLTGALYFFFFFNDTATPEFYTLPLHDALPIYESRRHESAEPEVDGCSFHCFSSALGAQHERGEHEVEGEDHERGGHHRARRRSGDAFRG